MTSYATAMAHKESRLVLHVRRVLLVIACAYIVSFSWSIFRRLDQVLRIEVHASSPTLAAGSTVGYDVVTTGQVPNRIRLDLVQGSHKEVLLEQRASMNRVSGIDPRVFRYTPTVTITPAMLARFKAGPATLRVIGFGGQKLLHTPAPKVREIPVTLAR